MARVHRRKRCPRFGRVCMWRPLLPVCVLLGSAISVSSNQTTEDKTDLLFDFYPKQVRAGIMSTCSAARFIYDKPSCVKASTILLDLCQNSKSCEVDFSKTWNNTSVGTVPEISDPKRPFGCILDTEKNKVLYYYCLFSSHTYSRTFT